MPVVGMVGAGQLARMTQQAAIALGVRFKVLADTADDAAAQVCGDVTVGDYRSFDDLAAFARGCDVVTFDHEHVPLPHVERLVASGVVVHPGPHALPFVQDKVRMRERLGEIGAPTPGWTTVANLAQIEDFARRHGWPVVAKTASGGYDGKGVWVLPDVPAAAELVAHVDAAGLTLYVEQHVGFRRELAVQVARSTTGETRAWPVVETVQRDGICTEVIAPAPELRPDVARAATDLGVRIATALDVVGVLAVELFELDDAGAPLVVNELAMRPHNSGHWTIEGARTSQFEQHLRAVLGWPLGDTGATAPVTAMANVLGGDGADAADVASRLPRALADRGAHVHLYGKSVRAGRKIGHVSVQDDDWRAARARALAAAGVLRGGDPGDPDDPGAPGEGGAQGIAVPATLTSTGATP
jgi:5-(carboxyamino)imidazole ribonucleotide synthase